MPIFNAAFGVSFVKGSSRLPCPALKIMAFIFSVRFYVELSRVTCHLATVDHNYFSLCLLFSILFHLARFARGSLT